MFNEELIEANNDLLLQIKDNMSQNILTELNTLSKKFKLNQFKKMQRISFRRR